MLSNQRIGVEQAGHEEGGVITIEISRGSR
jgi:hypothetical protein